MKKSVTVILAGMIVAQPLFAETNANMTIVPGLNGGPVLADSGDYNIKQISQDNTAVMKQIQDRMTQVQQIDRDYLNGVVERLNSRLNNLAKLKKDMSALSFKQASQFIELKDFLVLVNEINNEDQLIRNELQTLTLLTRESLPSFSPVAVGEMQASAVSVGNIDMKPLVTRVEALRVQMLNDINALRFNKLMVSAFKQLVPMPEKALEPNLTGIRVLTDAERAAYDADIAKNRVLSEKTLGYQQNLVDKTVNLINKFVYNYGSNEWLRFTDSNDGKALKEAYTDIVDAFMRRSYLRKKYGIRIGAIQSRGYPKQIVNSEKFRLQLQPLKVAAQSMRREAAIEQEDVKDAFENARNFVQLFDEKTTEVFGKRDDIMAKEVKQDDYSSKDTGILVRANAAITKVTDQVATAEILLLVMRMVLADAREEMMMFRSAYDELANFHDGRFRAGAEMKAQYNKHVCQMDWTLSEETHQKVCVPAGVKNKVQRLNVTSVSSVSEVFSELLAQFKNIEAAKWQVAANAQKVLDADLMSGKDAAQKQQEQDQEDDLFQ